jgi:hypothetical protein
MKRLVALALLLPSLLVADGNEAFKAQDRGDNLVLITIDGVRTEEMFGGLDLEVLNSTLRRGQKTEDSATYKRFWDPSREERRRRLMPFFWSLVTEQGSIAGDAQAGSSVRPQNRHWFSYPGYAEILLGEPHDEVIDSNNPIRNPYPTVLEGIRERLKLSPDKVATFAGWSVFNEISEHTEGASFINAGVERMEVSDEDVSLLNTLQSEATTPWDGIRLDVFTFRLAMKYLSSARPRVLHLAFAETDDWAHDGRYERVLDALSRTDAYLKELWGWLQAQPDYRGRTHMLITTDHGRGHTPKDWRDHNAKVAGSGDVWIGFVSPRMPQRGVWRDHAPLSTSQIAATLAGWMDLDWSASHAHAGRPIR